MQKSKSLVRCPAGCLVDLAKVENKIKQKERSNSGQRPSDHTILVSGLLVFGGISIVAVLFGLMVFAI